MSDTEYDAYAASNGLSWSRNLRGYRVSGLHGKWDEDHPPPDSDTFRLGRLVHAMVLEPDRVDEVFVKVDDETKKAAERLADKRPEPLDSLKDEDALLRCMVDGDAEQHFGIYDGARNAAHKKYQAWMADNPGKRAVKQSAWWDAHFVAVSLRELGARTLISADMWEQAERMASALLEHPLTRPFLTSPTLVTEEVVSWTDPQTGVALKAKIDGYDRERGVLLDVKMARTIAAHAFGRNATDYGYHAQVGGQYQEACRHGLGFEPRRVMLLTVERNPPHDVGRFDMGPEEIDAGRRAWREALELRQRCYETGHFPGQHSGPADLRLRDHAYDIDDALTFGGE